MSKAQNAMNRRLNRAAAAGYEANHATLRWPQASRRLKAHWRRVAAVTIEAWKSKP